MYFCKVLIFFSFCAGLQVCAQFSPLEVTGSGDGINENSTYSRLPLLDDNGDISTTVIEVDVLEESQENFTDTRSFSTEITVDETTATLPVSDIFTDSVTQNSQTTVPTTASPTTDLRTTDILGDFTTTSLLMTSTTTETTMIDDTTTVQDSTTTETTTKSTTVKTTKKPIKTDTATEIVETDSPKTKPKDTEAKIPATSGPASTVPIAEDAGKRCIFLDTGLQCDSEVICYGDGEIDCTDDEELNEADIDDEMPSSFDGMDYSSEGQTSDTFPIRRVDSNPQKSIFFKTKYYSFPPLTPINFTKFHEENMEPNDTMTDGDTENILDSETGTFPPPTQSVEFFKEYDDGKVLFSNDNSTNADFTDFEDISLESDATLTTNFLNASEIQITPKVNETTIYEEDGNNQTSTEAVTMYMELTTTDTLEKELLENVTENNNKDQLVITRTKRDKNANSSNGYHISNYKVSELESSKKKLKVKSCKLSGNLVCIPHPIKSSCSGKTLCQVPPQAIETVEKPATQKGLEKWTIAVIVICAITATFTIALLIYLIFTSYKKLKVQPQNGVTTLNYVNSAQP